MSDCRHNFLGDSICEHCGLYESTMHIAEIDRLRVENDRLRAALERIANDPHCMYVPGAGYETGVADGHRCAATKAREALSPDQ